MGRRVLPRHRPQRLRPGRRPVPEVAVLPAAPGAHPGARARSPTTRPRSSCSTSSLFLVALAGVYRLASRHGGPTVGAPVGVGAGAVPRVVRVLDDVPVGDLPRRVGVGVRAGRGRTTTSPPGWSRWARRWCGRTGSCSRSRSWSRCGRGGGRCWSRARRWSRWSRGASTARTAPAIRSCSSPPSRVGRRSRSSGLFEGHVKWSVLPHVVLALGALVVLVRAAQAAPACRGWCSARST